MNKTVVGVIIVALLGIIGFLLVGQTDPCVTRNEMQREFVREEDSVLEKYIPSTPKISTFAPDLMSESELRKYDEAVFACDRSLRN